MKVKDLVECMLGVTNYVIVHEGEVYFSGNGRVCMESDYADVNVVACEVKGISLRIEVEEV